MTKLLVIDTETGGVDPDRHSILSLAAVLWEDGEIRGEVEILIAEGDLMVTARALEINRIDLVAHSRQAIAPRVALALLLDFVSKHYRQELAAGEQVAIAGHNVGFDLGFLKRLCRIAGAEFPSVFSHRVLDTASVLRFLSLTGLLPAKAVASNGAFEYFGINIQAETRHSALGDARATAELLTRLVELVAPIRDRLQTNFAA
jgi:DNA polymerase III epsilon subunit-like protein